MRGTCTYHSQITRQQHFRKVTFLPIMMYVFDLSSRISIPVLFGNLCIVSVLIVSSYFVSLCYCYSLLFDRTFWMKMDARLVSGSFYRFFLQAETRAVALRNEPPQQVLMKPWLCGFGTASENLVNCTFLYQWGDFTIPSHKVASSLYSDSRVIRGRSLGKKRKKKSSLIRWNECMIYSG